MFIYLLKVLADYLFEYLPIISGLKATLHFNVIT